MTVVLPQILTRVLTFHFTQSVHADTGLPDVLEVVLLPLDNATDVATGTTFAGGLKTAVVELSQEVNTVTFDLIPSYAPGLAKPITYRVMWRAGLTGRTETIDFSMPDVDVSWEDLVAGLGNIISGESYLQQSDLGVPGRVARLDLNGHVIDADGVITATLGDLDGLTNGLHIETIQRQAADNRLQNILENELFNQIDATLSTANTHADNQVATVTRMVETEITDRTDADDALSTRIDTNVTWAQGVIDTFGDQLDTIQSGLDAKADLDPDTNQLVLDEVPDELITQVHPAANQAGMLALTFPTAHRGDLCIRPDGAFLLITNDPSQLVNWVSLTTVSAVNGHRGAVTLTAADVGAIALGGTITQGQVSGLSTALSGKAATTDLAALTTTVSTLAADPTVVHTVASLIAVGLMPANIALVNNSNQVTNKSGSVVAAGSGTGTITSVNGYNTPTITLTLSDLSTAGGAITEAQVTGLTTDLSNRVLGSDARLSNSRTPTAHAASHGVGQSDAVTVAQSQVTGLAAIISNNALTSGSNAVNRVSGLEGRVTVLEGGGGGGGGGGSASTTTVFYESANTSTPVTDFTQVFPHSPWGIDSDGTITGTIGTHYYLHSGVRDADAASPEITPNGHLRLTQWNEAGAADPTYALGSDLSALTTVVGTKALASDLTALTTVVGTKALASDLTTLSGRVDGKASQSDLTTLSTLVGTKASQSSLDTTNTNVAALSSSLATKAAMDGSGKVLLTEIPALPLSQTTGLVSGLAAKADLSGGTVLLAQIPTTIPQTSIVGLAASFAAKADLSGGTVPLGQLPAYPTSKVTGLDTALAGKATLDGTSHVPLVQIPLLALPNVQVVANKAAMLALTTSQVIPGALCVITATTDTGVYALTASDPSQFANWQKFPGGSTGTITSVNGYTGPSVTLTYADVGALASNATIPVTSVTGLTTQLNTFLTNSGLIKHADYVSTAAVATLSGSQSVDGVIMPVGAVVLTTGQSSSVNNGLWVVAAGAWTRPANFATGSFLAKDTTVIVTNTTGAAGGTTNPYTIWQETAAGGTIDTAVNNWSRVGYCAPAFVPAAANGITITGGNTFAAKTNPGAGVVVDTNGLAVDTNVVCRKVILTVPAGSTTPTLTHNLNTLRPSVTIYDIASNTQVLAGVTASSVNAISIEFASAPATGQYAAAIYG